MKMLASKVRDTLVSNGCEVVYFRVNESEKKVVGKVVYGDEVLYLHFSPDTIRVWDGVLSNEKERSAFAWGLREGWLHPQAMRPPMTLTDIPSGAVDKACGSINMKPLHYQGGFYVTKLVLACVAILSAKGLLGII